MVYCLQTSQTYDRCWAAYEISIGSHPASLRRFEAFLPYLPPAAHILDLGCGTGTFGRLALDDSPHRQITGYDFAPNMICAAKNKVPEGNFECQDIRNFEYPCHRYDAIILSFVINHLTASDLAVLIPKLSKALVENGLLYLSFSDSKKSGIDQPDFADKPLHYESYALRYVLRSLQDNGIAFLNLSTATDLIGTPPLSRAYYFFGHYIG